MNNTIISQVKRATCAFVLGMDPELAPQPLWYHLFPPSTHLAQPIDLGALPDVPHFGFDVCILRHAELVDPDQLRGAGGMQPHHPHSHLQQCIVQDAPINPGVRDGGLCPICTGTVWIVQLDNKLANLA